MCWPFNTLSSHFFQKYSTSEIHYIKQNASKHFPGEIHLNNKLNTNSMLEPLSASASCKHSGNNASFQEYLKLTNFKLILETIFGEVQAFRYLDAKTILNVLSNQPGNKSNITQCAVITL